MVNLVLLLQAAQDRHRILDCWFGHKDRLEAAGQGGVLFHMLAILIQGRRPDAMQVAPRQGRLEQVGGVHRPLGLARADQGVHLVDEQDDRALGLGHFVEHRLEPLLELTAIFCARDQRAHIQRLKLLVLQAFGHVAIDDAQSQTFDNSGLTDPGLADQYGVILGAAAQHLNGTADFLITADDRIKLAVAGRLGQVARIAFQRVITLFCRGTVGGLALTQGLSSLFQSRSICTSVFDCLGRVAAVLGDGNQQPLCGDEGISRRLSARLSLSKHPRGIGHHIELARSTLDLGPFAQQEIGSLIGIVGPAASAFNQGAAQAVLFLKQHLEQVLGGQLLVATRHGQALGRLDRLFGAVGIEINVHRSPRKAENQRSP